VDYKAILSLMKEMNHSDLTKLEIEEEGSRICIEKASNVVTMTAAPYVQQAPAVPFPVNPAAAMMQPLMQSFSEQPKYMTELSTENMAVNTAGNSTGNASISGNGNAADLQVQEADLKKIVSPMVGTFYASPSPDKSAFVKVGDRVKKGQAVCIIEAMKLLNEIESDHDGEIVKILVENEEMVEYGQPLFLIKE
jgi:acetyl-CoA carboxylase, biotin carboxyl carrier protein